MKLGDGKWCCRCKRYHNAPPVDINKIVDEKANEIARRIDAEVLAMMLNSPTKPV